MDPVPLVRVAQLRDLDAEAWVAQPLWDGERRLYVPGSGTGGSGPLRGFLEQHGDPPWPLDLTVLADRVELSDADVQGDFFRRMEHIRRWSGIVVYGEPVGDIEDVNEELYSALARRQRGFAGKRECKGIVLKRIDAAYPGHLDTVLCYSWVKVTRPVREKGGASAC